MPEEPAPRETSRGQGLPASAMGQRATGLRTMAAPHLRCLVVDDQRLLLDLLCTMLSAMPGLSVSGTATSCAEALELVTEDPPDLLLLDLAMGDGSGLEVATALAERHPEARVVVLSGQAAGFICPPQLRETICAVVDKTSAFNDLTAVLQRCLCSRPAGLTPRQQQIYGLIGQGMSNKEIARHTQLALSTVETHRKQIARKLGVSGAELVRQAALLAPAAETASSAGASQRPPSPGDAGSC